jgi:hypothetical protein
LAARVNAAARLDRLPTSAFHRRILWLIGIGMFFDGFDVYVAATVLGATLKSGFSTLSQNAQFVSVTFVGMMLGSFLTGFLGDRYGRRFTYQANLAIFGLASIASAFAPSMQILIALRCIMGLGLGAEIVVGFSTLTEFVPPLLHRSFQFTNYRAGQHTDHSTLRVAHDVRSRRIGCAYRLVFEEGIAGVTAMAGIRGP